MTTIMVGFDRSEESRDALRLGDRLARVEGAELLVAAAGLFEPQISTKAERVDAMASRRALFADVSEELGEGRHYASAMVEGLPAAHGLISIAAEWDADLIVVGSTHRGRLGRVLPGSVGAQLLHGAPCPVAIAPRGFRDSERDVHGRIGVAYDGSPEADLALAEACHLSRILEAPLLLIAVVPEAEAAEHAVGASAEGRLHRRSISAAVETALEALPADVEADAAVIEGDPGGKLVESCGDLDMIVMGSRGRGPLRRTLLGTVSAHVCASAECPVVVAPRGAEVGADALASMGSSSRAEDE